MHYTGMWLMAIIGCEPDWGTSYRNFSDPARIRQTGPFLLSHKSPNLTDSPFPFSSAR